MNESKIYLYLKESPLGLKYLGQTIKNPFKYEGSGTRWKRHLKKYKIEKDKVKTTILLKSFDREEIKKLAIHYSKFWNIVKSKKWANLVIETGENYRVNYTVKKDTLLKMRIANLGKKLSEKTKLKISKAAKGRRATKDTKDKISESKQGIKNPMYGKFGILHPKTKEIFQYSKSKELIKKWKCVLEASSTLGISESSIRNSLYGNKKSLISLGVKYYWTYNEQEKFIHE